MALTRDILSASPGCWSSITYRAVIPCEWPVICNLQTNIVFWTLIHLYITHLSWPVSCSMYSITLGRSWHPIFHQVKFQNSPNIWSGDSSCKYKIVWRNILTTYCMISWVDIPPVIDHPDIITLVREEKPKTIVCSSQDQLCWGRLISMKMKNRRPRGRTRIISGPGYPGNIELLVIWFMIYNISPMNCQYIPIICCHCVCLCSVSLLLYKVCSLASVSGPGACII